VNQEQQENKHMRIKYPAGTERKKLTAAAAEHLGAKSTYAGAPSMAYLIGGFTLNREGALTGPDDRALVDALRQQGFAPTEEAYDEQPGRPDRLTVEAPIGPEFTLEKMVNLEKLVSSRALLLMKVLGADALPIEQTEHSLKFPWFPMDNNAVVYSQLACALVRAATEATRITAREQQDCASEKFRMRTLLLRLNFIGPEFAQARKVLTRGLSGNGSYARPKATGEEGGVDNA
jgi:hypothetical protein